MREGESKSARHLKSPPQLFEFLFIGMSSRINFTGACIEYVADVCLHVRVLYRVLFEFLFIGMSSRFNFIGACIEYVADVCLHIRVLYRVKDISGFFFSLLTGADLPPFSEDSDGLMRSGGNVIDEEDEGEGEELFGDDMERFVLGRILFFFLNLWKG